MQHLIQFFLCLATAGHSLASVIPRQVLDKTEIVNITSVSAIKATPTTLQSLAVRNAVHSHWTNTTLSLEAEPATVTHIVYEDKPVEPLPDSSKDTVLKVVYVIDVPATKEFEGTVSPALQNAAMVAMQQSSRYSNQTAEVEHTGNAYPNGVVLEIYNGKQDTISLVWQRMAGAPKPWAIGGDSRQIGPGGYLQASLPLGYAGMIALDHVEGSKIEISNTGPQLHMDVSFVDGWTHEIVCSCGNKPVTGCNKSLYDLNTCSSYANGYCRNPARAYNKGPPSDFFAPCEGSAYTYPEDNLADRACRAGDVLKCCIGPDCKPPPNQIS